MLSKLLWKTVRETGTYHYQEHRFLKRKRRAVAQNGTTRPPRHKLWLAGGPFTANSNVNTIRGASGDSPLVRAATGRHEM
jgi:hypothetical protein